MKVFVLSLDSDTTRLNDFRNGYPSSLALPSVWRAKPPEECSQPDWWRGSKEFWSNTENVCDVLSFAKEQTENVLFFEDDCIFAEDFKSQWETFMNEVPKDYDLINLCTLHMCSMAYPPIQVSENVLRAKLGFNTNALIITPNGACKMLEQIQKPNWPCRHVCEQQLGYLYLSSDFNAYSPLQNFIGQRACYSTLCKRDRGERWYNKFIYLDMNGKMHKSEGRYEKE